MDSKKTLTAEQIRECKALDDIYKRKKKDLGLTQELIGHELGISTGAVGHYLKGRNALNLNIAVGFARLLGVSISEFSPRLGKLLKGESDPLKDELLKLAENLPTEELEILVEQARARIRIMNRRK